MTRSPQLISDPPEGEMPKGREGRLWGSGDQDRLIVGNF